MIDTLPAGYTLADVRRLHPVAPIVRWDRKAAVWLVFHSVEAACNHASTEGPKPVSAHKPAVLKRNW